MVSNRAWDDVLRRARSRPQELNLQDDSTGNTLLHEACRLDPPADVIRALQGTCRVKNLQGATPIHIAASHRCSAEALRVLLDIAKQTPRERDDTSPTADLSNMGRAPVHYACMSFRGLEIDAFMLLLDETLKFGNLTLDTEQRWGFDSFIDEGMEDLDDDDDDFYQAPVFEDKEKVTVNVMSMKDSLGMTPLALLFHRYRQRVRTVISTVDQMRSDNRTAPNQAALASAMTVQAELGELWEKARRIVARLTEERLNREGTELEELEPPIRSPGEQAVQQEAAQWAAEKHRRGKPAKDDVLPVYVVAVERDSSLSPTNGVSGKCRQFRIVHASVGLIGYGCPPEMIRLAISIHPHQVREMDEDGNLPLHLAVKASSYFSPTDLLSAPRVTDASDDLSVLSDAMSFFSSATISQTNNPFDKVIKILLQHYPEAAQIPQGETGQLPLVMAIESGRRTWDDGIRTLLNAFPPALHNKKLIEPEVYPAVLALVSRVSPELSLLNGDECRGCGRSKKRRQDACARTTLFELIRAKPDWLTAEGRKLDTCR